MKVYRLEITIDRQEDGLWRAEVPSLPGCFVDAETVHEAISAIQGIAAMMLDLSIEDEPLGTGGHETTPDVSFEVSLPVLPQEHAFRRLPRQKARSKRSA